MENGGEVCLEEEVERLRRAGRSVAEISQEMGVNQVWVEELVARAPDGGAPDPVGAEPEEGRDSL